jgi:hypothetical protein
MQTSKTQTRAFLTPRSFRTILVVPFFLTASCQEQFVSAFDVNFERGCSLPFASTNNQTEEPTELLSDRGYQIQLSPDRLTALFFDRTGECLLKVESRHEVISIQLPPTVLEARPNENNPALSEWRERYDRLLETCRQDQERFRQYLIEDRVLSQSYLLELEIQGASDTDACGMWVPRDGTGRDLVIGQVRFRVYLLGNYAMWGKES